MTDHRAAAIAAARPYHPPDCPFCGRPKVPYSDRKRAKKAAKVTSHRRHLTPYRCGPVWHLGTPPQAAMMGTMSRDEVYGR